MKSAQQCVVFRDVYMCGRAAKRQNEFVGRERKAMKMKPAIIARKRAKAIFWKSYDSAVS